MVPASIFARGLEIRLVDTVCISCYDFKDQGDIKILIPIDIDSNNDWLLIDDLVEIGKSARIHYRSQPGHLDLFSPEMRKASSWNL